MMLKRMVAVFLLLLVLCMPLAALSYARDFAVTFGHMALFDGYQSNGLHGYFGISKGLTEQFEANIFTQVELTPSIVSDVQIGFDVSYSLLGKRWDAEGYAGSGVNMLASAGILTGFHNPEGRFAIDSVFVRLTPVTVGSSHSGKRDRFLSMGLAWNFHEKKLSLLWNILLSDIYITGTYKGVEY